MLSFGAEGGRHGVGVEGGLGKLAGGVRRVGLVGENPRERCVARRVAALHAGVR